MPPRKSDPNRKSDVSVARFVLADEQSPAAQSPAPVEAPAFTSASATPADAPTVFPLSEKKDKEKDKDKDKEKDKEKDAERRDTAISIEDLQLPRSIITRLSKGVLPPNTQIQGNATLAMTKSATVFINHLANAANEITTMQNKKTIMPADVFRALDEIEFGFMRERVEAEFAKFNEVQTSKRTTYRKKVAAAKKAATGEGGPDSSMVSMPEGDTTMNDSALASGTDTSALQQPRSKKPRTDDAEGLDSSRMELDDDAQDPSDAETVPDEPEEDEDEDDVEEEEQEEDDDEEGADEERDDVEERENGVDQDEALDDGEESE